MQSLKFLGTGDSLGFEHTNAYFETDEDFVLLDISMLNVEAAVSLCPKEKEMWVLITHMHYDCTSGLALLIRLCYERCKKRLHILCGDADMIVDVNKFLSLQGVRRDTYCIDIAEKGIYGKEWFLGKINADPDMQMGMWCYSYILKVNGRDILYVAHFLRHGLYDSIRIDEAYLPVRAYSWTVYDPVYYYANDYNEIIKIAERADVFFTHVDDKEYMEKELACADIKIAEK